MDVRVRMNKLAQNSIKISLSAPGRRAHAKVERCQ